MATRAAPRPVLLDTCAAIWLANGDPLSAESRAAIADAASAGVGVFVSPISAWEAATLAARGRLRFSLAVESWFDALVALPGIRLAPISPAILIASAALPGAPPREPADRIIAATARALGLAIVTRDREFVPYAKAGHVVLIRC